MNKTKNNTSGRLAFGWGDILNVVKSASRLRLLALAATALMGFAVPSSAQTVGLISTNQNVFVGANFNGIYTNSQLRASVASLGGVPVTLSVSGAPAGVTILFSTNTYALTANPIGFTNSWNPIWYSVAVTNVTKGVYPLTFTCSGGASTSIVVNLIVGTLWTSSTQAGSAADVQWLTGANWSTGNGPGSGDAVIFTDSGNTNYMSSSVSVDSLTFIPLANGTNQNMLIAPGQTLSVVGTNGFAVNSDSVTANSKTYVLNIFGPGASLVVTNSSGDFTINGDNTGAAGSTVTMTNLDNFSAAVNRFGLGDWTMAKQGGVGANFVVVSFAKTNVIKASFAGDYGLTNLTPKFSISMLQNGDPFNNGSANIVNLGLSNAIYAESLGYALNRAGGNPQPFRFNPVFTNGALGVPYVLFRNTNGGRMNLVGVGVDSGASNPGSNARGVLNFAGGIVDMLVDTMWLGRDRAMTATTNNGAVGLGVLTFTGGKVDVNYLRAGFQAYSNNSTAQGQINVGGSGSTTAVLSVNTNLELGFTAGDFSATPGSLASGGNGQVTINTNGIVRANLVTVGTYSANNFITINNGGLLDVTNTVADVNKNLTTLTSAGGALTLHINGANTLVYVTNLTATATSPINIASISGIGSFPVTISVISYKSATSPNSWVGGTVAGGLNASVANNAGNKSIDITLTTGTPKLLKWVGDLGGGVWNTVTTNWIDLATSLRTNFSTGDSVIFDDSASNSSVTLGEDLVPSQTGTGIAITNNSLAYTFSGSGRILGGASLVKQGASTLEIDSYTEVAVQAKAGVLAGSGTLGSAIISSGAVLNWFGVNILGGVTSAGYVTNAGTIGAGVTLQAGGVLTNAHNINGSFSTATNTLLVNLPSGDMAGIGDSTVGANSTVINRGIMDGKSLTVNAGAILEDTGEGYISLTTSAGASGVLTIGAKATFIPGGDGIGSTFVFANGGPSGSFPGRVAFAAGSTNVFKINLDTPANTILYSGAQVFGGSQLQQTVDGGTIKMVLLGSTPYAAGQSFQMFESSDTLSPPILSAGTNTANSFPVMDPASPGTGLAWDLRDLMTNGIIRIRGVATTLTNLGFSPTLATIILTNITATTTNISTNYDVLSQLSWPATNIGWRLQQQQDSLAVGLIPNTNWSDIFASYWTNSLILTNNFQTNQAFFFRMTYP